MKWIDKKRENQPNSLVKHLKTPHHNYNNYKDKDQLRVALVQEQGFICCYCMKRIQEPVAGKMEIEHFKSQSLYNGKANYPDLTLDYMNLLGSCKGNEGNPKHLQHCDEHKKEHDILVNPTDENMMDKIRFSSEGKIFFDEKDDPNGKLNDDLTNTLNLNLQSLSNQRKAIWRTLDQLLRKKFNNKPSAKGFIQQQLKKISSRNDDKLEPFCQVYIFYWERKLKYAV